MKEPSRNERHAAMEAARQETMNAQNFIWFAEMMDFDEMRVTVTHKLSKRKWVQIATEGTWPDVRANLLVTIEKDLTPEPVT